MDKARLCENIAAVRFRLAQAAARGGHPVPRLVAVTKKTTDAAFLAVAEMGLETAENYPQAFERRYALLTGQPVCPPMHLIGSLQTNKVKLVVGKAALIHSADSLHLLSALERQSEKVGVVQKILLEVNSGREAAKGGALPEDIPALAEAAASLPHLCLCGLMTMGPVCEDPEDIRPALRETRRLFERLCGEGYFGADPILSMGMSRSYEIAAEEGATLVRVGTALFAGADDPPKSPDDSAPTA